MSLYFISFQARLEQQQIEQQQWLQVQNALQQQQLQLQQQQPTTRLTIPQTSENKEDDDYS